MHEELFNITAKQRNANQNHSEITLCPFEYAKSQDRSIN